MSDTIKLPDPQKHLGYPLMRALANRRSKRKWKDILLTGQELSNILWAACGINQEETKRAKCKRTAPSSGNSQSIKLYVALSDGLFLYEEKNHALKRISDKDMREHLSNQKMMRSAPAGLIYVSDYSKLKGYLGKDDRQRWFIAGTETGFISQNVYLYCASDELNTVVIGLVDRDKLHELMGLPDHEKVVFTQVIGKPVDE